MVKAGKGWYEAYRQELLLNPDWVVEYYERPPWWWLACRSDRNQGG